MTMFTLTSTSFWDGWVDELRIYNRALSAAEVNALYRSYAAPFVATGETSYGLIESIENISGPPTDIQENRAPNQDGATYLDSLFRSRDIVVKGALRVPTDIDAIDTQRAAIIEHFNPKYGPGELEYYYGKSQIKKKIAYSVVPGSVVFRNRAYNRPFQEFQLTLEAKDPYFYGDVNDVQGIQIFSGQTVTVNVAGPCDVFFTLRIYGAANNPNFVNATTGETISLQYGLLSNEYVEINTAFGAKTVKKNNGTNLIGFLNLGSTLGLLRTGDNQITYTGGGYVILQWRNRYIGV